VTVFTGADGFVELQRTAEDQSQIVRDVLNKADINTDVRRFSVDKNGVGGMFLLTGDRVSISYGADPQTEPLENPWLVANHTNSEGKYYPDWTGYVGVDAIGGIRLFDTYELAVTNKSSDALPLQGTQDQCTIRFEQQNIDFRCAALMQGYTFTTERSTIDVTRLGDSFRKQYEAGLISGQGNLDCLWHNNSSRCDNTLSCGDTEFSIFLSQLCIRVITGARFTARFIVFFNGAQSVFYEAGCVVTNASIEVQADQAVRSTIDFATTGTIQLKVGSVPGLIEVDRPDGVAVMGIDDALLQESFSPIYQDD